jgi:hypothetical protein
VDLKRYKNGRHQKPDQPVNGNQHSNHDRTLIVAPGEPRSPEAWDSERIRKRKGGPRWLRRGKSRANFFYAWLYPESSSTCALRAHHSGAALIDH